MTLRISLYFTCLVWSLASTTAFLAIPAALSCHQNRWLTAGGCVGGLATRGLLGHRRSKDSSNLLMILSGGDDGGKSFGEEAMRERTNAELQEMVSKHKILAFIKGTRFMPQCGYSGTMVNILQSLSVPFETIDVLADDHIRQGIKEFSNWPTIPQLYLDGEFIGGADIVIELFQAGELQEMIEIAAAS